MVLEIPVHCWASVSLDESTDLTGPFQRKADMVAMPSGSYNPVRFWPCHYQGPTGKKQPHGLEYVTYCFKTRSLQFARGCLTQA